MRFVIKIPMTIARAKGIPQPFEASVELFADDVEKAKQVIESHLQYLLGTDVPNRNYSI